MESHRDGEGRSPLGYMPQLDALRALAAFGVFVQHFVASGSLFATTIPLGDLGVRLFFVLSGFLITGILLTARANVAQGRLSLGAVVGHFYARRFLRLAPLYFAFLALMFFFIPDVRSDALWFLAYAQNVHFALEDEFTVAPHLWTLAVEEQFYLFWPLVVLLVPAKRLLPVVAAIAALGVVSRLAAPLFGLTHFQASMLTPSHFDSLGLGALLAVAAASERLAASPLHPDLRLAFGGGVGILGEVVAAKLAGLPSGVELVLGELGAALVFVWVIGNAAGGYPGFAGRVLASAPLVYLGKISYGMYVLHWFAPHVLGTLAGALGFDLPQNQWLRLLLFSAASIAAAAASWHLLEAPMLKLKRFFSYSRQGVAARRARAEVPAG